MTSYAIALTCLTALVTVANMTSHWFLSKGRIIYVLNMFVFAGFTTVEAMVAFHDGQQLSMLFFVIMDVWAFAMAFKGFLRLRKKNEAA